MSRENVELIRRAYGRVNEMLASGEVDRALIEELWTPDCVLTPAGILPETAEMHGHQGIEQFTKNQIEAFADLRMDALEFVDAGDKVVVPIQFGGKARYTGLDVAFTVVHVATVRSGRVARVDMFREKAEALEAAGLPP